MKKWTNEQVEVLNQHDLSACQEQIFWCIARWTNAGLLLAYERGEKQPKHRLAELAWLRNKRGEAWLTCRWSNTRVDEGGEKM